MNLSTPTLSNFSNLALLFNNNNCKLCYNEYMETKYFYKTMKKIRIENYEFHYFILQKLRC